MEHGITSHLSAILTRFVHGEHTGKKTGRPAVNSSVSLSCLFLLFMLFQILQDLYGIGCRTLADLIAAAP
jgi:hypothetical protein